MLTPTDYPHDQVQDTPANNRINFWLEASGFLSFLPIRNVFNPNLLLQVDFMNEQKLHILKVNKEIIKL